MDSKKRIMSLILAGIMGSGSCLPVMAESDDEDEVMGASSTSSEGREAGKRGRDDTPESEESEKPEQKKVKVMSQAEFAKKMNGMKDFIAKAMEKVMAQRKENEKDEDGSDTSDDEDENISREEYEAKNYWIDEQYRVYSEELDMYRLDKGEFSDFFKNYLKSQKGITLLKEVSDEDILVACMARDEFNGILDGRNYIKYCEMVSGKKWENMSPEERDNFEKMKEQVCDRVKKMLNKEIVSLSKYIDSYCAMRMLPEDAGEGKAVESGWMEALNESTDKIEQEYGAYPYGEIQFEEIDEEAQAQILKSRSEEIKKAAEYVENCSNWDWLDANFKKEGLPDLKKFENQSCRIDKGLSDLDWLIRCMWVNRVLNEENDRIIKQDAEKIHIYYSLTKCKINANKNDEFCRYAHEVKTALDREDGILGREYLIDSFYYMVTVSKAILDEEWQTRLVKVDNAITRTREAMENEVKEYVKALDLSWLKDGYEIKDETDYGIFWRFYQSNGDEVQDSYLRAVSIYYVLKGIDTDEVICERINKLCQYYTGYPIEVFGLRARKNMFFYYAHELKYKLEHSEVLRPDQMVIVEALTEILKENEDNVRVLGLLRQAKTERSNIGLKIVVPVPMGIIPKGPHIPSLHERWAKSREEQIRQQEQQSKK